MPPPVTTTTTTTTIAPGPWMCTPLIGGPLGTNSYCMTISGLSANTCYEYRSVFVVSGTCYCACNSLCGITQPNPVVVPIGVTTGNAFNVFSTGYYITGASTTCDGGAPITEWGHLYTSNPSYNTISTLTYENLPTNVNKSCYTGSHTIPPTYYFNASIASGLPSGSVTWFRAYAKNSAGIGYGNIKSQITQSEPPPTITETYNQGTPGAFRFQYFEVGSSILAADVFSVTVYSHTVSVTAIAGDTPLSIVNKLIVAVNATTPAQWNSAGSAPPSGTVGFPPTATLSILGATLVLRLNYQNAFAASAYRP